MRDRDVRAALHRQLTLEHASEMASTLFVDELGLCGEVRVDVAVVNGSLSGFELKSASDNLRRLPTQVNVYSRVLDFATLVVAENHLDAANELLPPWWGCVIVGWSDGAAHLEHVRRSASNPQIEGHSLAQLLWRDEALSALSQRGLDAGYRSKSRAAIWDRLADSLELDELRDEVRSRLKTRRGWRSAR